MYELEARDHSARERYFAQHPELVRRTPPDIASHASRVAVLAWSEHCVECAIPHCYSTCDLYDARRDGKCRRFTFGIHENAELATWLPYAVEIDFRLISHLWTKGNIRTIPLGLYRATDALQRATGRVVEVLGGLTPRRRLQRGFYHARKRVVEWLQRAGGTKADGFLFQAINPQDETLIVRFEVGMDPRVTGEPFFQARFELAPGFSEHWVPCSEIEKLVALGSPFDVSLLLGNVKPKLLYVLCAEFVGRLRGPLAERRSEAPAVAAVAVQSSIKAVIWDLDNTLWRGVLVESELTKPPLRDGIVEIVRALDERGILQSVASKNNHEEAMELLRELGLEEYFLFPRIDWNPKSRNVQAIIDDLNIGAETVAFIDDQPFERGEVAANVPGVVVLPETAIPGLLADHRFKGSTSAESRRRREMYREQSRRAKASSEYAGDYVEFLRSCGMKVDARAPEEAEMVRTQELIQRTNQMNFSGNRYSREQLVELLASPGMSCFALRCSDRYGDYGIVGFCAVERRGDTARMIDLAMSCRVQAKHVEHTFLLALTRHLAQQGVRSFECEFRRTPRNSPVGKVFEDLGFTRGADDDGVEIWVAPEVEKLPMLDYVQVTMPEVPDASVPSAHSG